MNRTEAREYMMQIFYQLDMLSNLPSEPEEHFLDQEKAKEQYDYCHKLYSIYHEKKDEMDQLIEENSVGWSIKRMAKTDAAILRVAISEILYLNDEEIPASVSANEAVELAKKYGTDRAPKFVNAILGNIIRANS